jgi:hypothetical protein
MAGMNFIDQWNALDPRERCQLRRLVRMGRPIEDAHLARLAAEYAAYQSERPWMRLFWIWFVPGVLVALSIAAGIHPVLIGVVLALGAQAVLAKFNLRKTARLATSTA